MEKKRKSNRSKSLHHVIRYSIQQNAIKTHFEFRIKHNQTEILELHVHNEHDGGTFTCSAINSIGKSEKQFFVDIFFPPTFEYVSTNRHKISINRTYTLPCLVKGIPRPTIKWFRNGKEIQVDVKTKQFLVKITRFSFFFRINILNYFEIINILKYEMLMKMTLECICV